MGNHSKGDVASGMEWCWHPALPKEISVCMWKEKFQCLLVDNRLQGRDICLVLKYDHCPQLEKEMIDHILCSGEFAQAIWSRVEYSKYKLHAKNYVVVLGISMACLH